MWKTIVAMSCLRLSDVAVDLVQTVPGTIDMISEGKIVQHRAAMIRATKIIEATLAFGAVFVNHVVEAVGTDAGSK
jgi:hypothetical protein